MLELIVEAVLVEGVLAQEVDGWEGQGTHTQAALHDLEHLGSLPNSTTQTESVNITHMGRRERRKRRKECGDQ